MLHVQFDVPSWIHLKCFLNTGLAKQDTSDMLWKAEIKKKRTTSKKKNLPIVSSSQDTITQPNGWFWYLTHSRYIHTPVCVCGKT